MSDYLSGINSVNSNYSMSISSVGASQRLTEETKKKLEALGVDTKNIRTEQEGQKKLKEVQAAQQAQQTQQSQQAQATQQQPSQQQSGSMASLISDVKDLAREVGVSVPQGAKIENVFDDIQNKITQIRLSKVNSIDKDSEAMAASYQMRYDYLYNQFQSKAQARSMITNSLNALASYNMAMIK